MCTNCKVSSFSRSTYILGPTNLNGFVTWPRLLRWLFVNIIVNILTMLSTGHALGRHWSLGQTICTPLLLILRKKILTTSCLRLLLHPY